MSQTDPKSSGEQFERSAAKTMSRSRYRDALEGALAEQPVSAIESRPFASIAPTAKPSLKAVAELAGLKVACLLVADQGKLVGVFSDRDVLNTASPWSMTSFSEAPDVVRDDGSTRSSFATTDSAAAALCVMAVSGYRHVPVVDADDQIIGIVSPQRVTEFLKRSIGE